MEINQIIVNDQSTLDFPFETVVVENGGFTYAKKKNNLIETDLGSGAIKNEVNAWPPIEKSYQLFCYTSDVTKLRAVKMWAQDHGILISSDESDVYYEILDVTIDDVKRDRNPFFVLDIIFTVNPFGYEHNPQTKRLNNGDIFYHNTNAPMYPKIVIHGSSATPTTLKIGDNVIQLKKLADGLTIENKPLYQNVYDAGGVEQNAVMQGDFFEIQPGSENIVQFGPGITSIEMLDRRAWV